MVRKNNDFAEFNVHLIHRKQVPLLHFTVLILCYEGDGLVAVTVHNFFLSKIYVVGAHKNPFIVMVLLSSQNK